MKRSNLSVRVFTGMAGGAAVVLAVILSQWTLLLFCLLIASLAHFEFMVMHGQQKPRALLWICNLIFMIIFLVGAYFVNQNSFPFFLLWICFLPALFSFLLNIVLLYLRSVESAAVYSSLTLLAFFYTVLPMFLLYTSGSYGGVYNYYVPLGILLLMWSMDSFAYFAGRLFGRHKLFPAVSPGKTWEGTIGGAICTLLLGWSMGSWLQVNSVNWLIPAAIIIVFGQWGDLVESLFKRQSGVKDSGALLPGHGGILDRFDGLITSIPFVFIYLCYTANVKFWP